MIEYRPLVYVAPSGDSVEFVYDGVITDSVEHATSTFRFSGIDGSYSQDLSTDSGEYPFTVFLTGSERVEELITIRRLLNEKGTEDNFGRLEHPDPSIGTFDCVVNGYSVAHNVVNNINVITISISFSRTIDNLRDGGISFSAQDIYTQSLSIFEQFAEDFKNAIDTGNGYSVSALISDTTKTIDTATSIFASITSEVDDVTIAFQDATAEILSSVDALARAPETLASSVQNLLMLPALFSDDVVSRVNAYSAMIDSALNFSDDQSSEIEGGSSVGKSYLANAVMVSNAALTGLLQVYSTTESTTLDDIKRGNANGFSSRKDINHAIQNVLEYLATISIEISERAKGFSNISFFKQYFDHTLLIKPLVKSAVANLQNRLSLLPLGRGAILPYDESPVVLCAKIYNTVEIDVLQFFYESNDIHGDEMFLLRKGREITWYGESIFESSIDSFIPIIVEPEIDIWQDTPWDSGNEQIQDQPFLTDEQNVQDVPTED